MAAQAGSANRGTPVFRFLIECGGNVSAAFAECSGLKAEVDVFKYEEGGQNEFVHQLPGRRKWSNIVLKRGVTDSLDLWDWYKEKIAKDRRRNISIILYDETHQSGTRWELQGAYPVRWEGPAMKADGNTVAIETLELAHNGFEMKQQT